MSGARGRRIAVAAAALLAVGCSSGPRAPDWQSDAAGSLDRATSAWLSGDSRTEAMEFARARAQLARTGRPAVVAQAELLRCATRIAALAYDGCPGFDALAADARPEQLAYARYLDGVADAADLALLPASQRALAASGASPSAIAAADDPLSALVAAGVALRRGAAGRASVEAVIERASHQGWRRPLLAWLLVLQRASEPDPAQALRIQRRIDLLTPPPDDSR